MIWLTLNFRIGDQNEAAGAVVAAVVAGEPMNNKELDLMMGQIRAWASAVTGKRSSPAQSQKARKHCSGCKAPLPPPHTPGAKYCILCSPAKMHRVYMSFTHGCGWQCSFLEGDLKTPLPKQLTFRDAAKIYETARRGNGLTNDATRQTLDRDVEIGRGAIWLYLSDGQYQALKGLLAK